MKFPRHGFSSLVAILLFAPILFSCKDDEETPAAEIVAISPTAGPKGTQLTIAGANFGTVIAEVEVTINDKPAEITSVTNNKIVVVVPEKAGSGKVNTKIRGIALSSQPAFTYELSVTTFAGSGQRGFVDGLGVAAKFYAPSGIALDVTGNLFVTDYVNGSIRKISSEGAVTTFAGKLGLGFQDGPGELARFAGPHGAVLDKAGNLFVADEVNNRIRKITPDGTATTFAGKVYGFNDGMGSTASFANPSGIAIDKDDNLYVADQANNRIRKITPAGMVTTFAGSGVADWLDGTGVAAGFFRPVGLAIDPLGNVFVGDSFNHRIRKITPAGLVTTVAGFREPGFVDGPKDLALFNYPAGLALGSDGSIYVADTENYSIRKVDANGNVTTFSGRSDGHFDGTLEFALFRSPRDIEIAPDGTIYVVDMNDHRIRKID